MEPGIAERTSQAPRPLHVEVKVVLGRVADRAVALERGARREERRVGGLRDGHADVDGLERHSRAIYERTRELECDTRVRKVVLHRLE